MERIYNFSAGPAVLPREVLEQARDELVNWQGCGMSVMEMSHRGKDFTAIAEATEQDLRDLMAIPPNYKILFLQGGASSQFAMVPMNLIGRTGQADYLNTGIWSQKAISEAKRYGEVRVVASSEADGFRHAPDFAAWDRSSGAAYLHYTPNETIGGVEIFPLPDTGEVPLVADMSSNILSRAVDVSRFGLIYAGAQKNIGPAGLTLVIVREDLLDRALPFTPTMLNYRIHADNGSMYNTPPTYGIYMAGLVFRWLKERGGIPAMEKVNQAKAQLLYGFLDGSDFYENRVAPANRSHMNVPFQLRDETNNEAFLAEAAQAGLVQLKGHKSVGGMRASIYNAMPLEGVQALVRFMRDFAQRHG